MGIPMGTLRPGATYVYERVDGRIYAREFGKTDRQLVGYELKQQEHAERRYYMNHINDVLTMCETDLAMRELLDQLFVLYNLKKCHDR
jgi:hypothetical protein